MLENQRCDWLTRFMKVILLGLSLVSTSLQVLQYRFGIVVWCLRQFFLHMIQYLKYALYFSSSFLSFPTSFNP
jgi:hypothetical protein